MPPVPNTDIAAKMLAHMRRGRKYSFIELYDPMMGSGEGKARATLNDLVEKGEVAKERRGSFIFYSIPVDEEEAKPEPVAPRIVDLLRRKPWKPGAEYDRAYARVEAARAMGGKP